MGNAQGRPASERKGRAEGERARPRESSGEAAGDWIDTQLQERRRELAFEQEMRRLESRARNQANIEARRAAYARSASEPVSCFYAVFCSCWAMGHRFSWVVQDIIDGIEAGEAEKLQLWEYYVKMVEDYEAQARRAGWWLVHLQMLRTTFNIVLPAILALQNLGSLSAVIMWLTWGLSLAVSLATGYIDLFKLQQRFEMLTRASEYLKLEGWQFFGLIGRYGKFDSHHRALNLFLFRVAKIRKRIIDMEFPPTQRSSEAADNNPNAAAAGTPRTAGAGQAVQPSPMGHASGLFVGPSFSEEDEGQDSERVSSAFFRVAAKHRNSAPPVPGMPPTPTPRTQAPPPPTPSLATPHAQRPTPRSLVVASRDTEDEESDDETVKM
jgi:hypothetical protein